MRRPVGGMGTAGGTPQDWFQQLPIITKIILTSTVLSAACVSFGFISPMSLIFHWPSVYYKFEIWRLLSSFLFAGSFSFPFLMHVYMLYQNSVRYEASPFNTGARGTSADYLWMLIFSMGVICFLGYIFELPLLSEPFLYVIMYVWSRREPEAQANIFGFKFQAIYLPWLYVALRLLMGNSIVGPLVGIAAGHLYYFLVDILPNSHGMELIKTPEFCVNIIEQLTGFSQPSLAGRGSTGPPAARNENGPQGGNRGVFPRGGYNWGAGRTLGTS